MATDYVGTMEELKTAIDRAYNYCVFRDKPNRITAFRDKSARIGGIMYSHRIESVEELHQIRTMFPISDEIFALSAHLTKRLLRDGFLVDDDGHSIVTHSFKIIHGRNVWFYYGTMSDEEAVIQGFRHGAVEIKRVGEVLV